MKYLPGFLQFLHADLGEAEGLDLAFLLQIAQHGELLLAVHLGVDPVQLQEVEGVDLELAQAQFRLLAQVFGPADRNPDVGSGAGEPHLRGDPDAVPVGVQASANDFLADVGAVRVGGVNEVDAKLHGAAHHGDRGGAVCRLAPDAVADDPHGAEAQPVDGSQVLQGDRGGYFRML